MWRNPFSSRSNAERDVTSICRSEEVSKRKKKKIPDDTRTNGLNVTNKIEERVSSIKYIKYHTQYIEHVLHHQRLFGRNVVIINKSDNI
jgi:hypothetical protein